jgi:GT2 family glycosyltransferase
VIIVAYNSRQYLGPALDLLEEGVERGEIQCVLVDNASRDGTADFVAESYPWVELVRSRDNLGFGRGCNLGFERVTAPYVLVHNPDAAIELASIRALADFMDAHPRVGITAPAILHGENNLQFVGMMTTPGSVIRGALGRPGNKPMFRDVAPGTPAFQTNWVCGAMMLIRSDLYRRLGGFDPRFFLYFEETDLCRRTVDQGMEIWSVGEAVARHAGAASAKTTGESLAGGCIAEHYYRSRFYYLGKHFGWPRAVFAEGLDWLMTAARWGKETLGGNPKRANPFRQRPFLRLPARPAVPSVAQTASGELASVGLSGAAAARATRPVPRTRIRPLEPADIPAVAALHHQIIRKGIGPAPAGLEAAFRRLFIEAPVCARDLPSLVLEADGEIAGFQGVQVREFEFDGARRRLASLGPVFVAPELRVRGAGAQLLKAAMAGGQDLTMSDGAADASRQLWEMLGGRMAPAQTLEWQVFLHPARQAASVLASQGGVRRALARALYPLAVVVDRTIDSRWNKALRNPPAAPAARVPLSVARFRELDAAVDPGYRLRMVYPPEVAEWIFDELQAYSCRGELVAREVRDDRGAIGWFIAQAWPDRIFRLLQVQAQPRNLSRVFAAAMAEASERRLYAVSGRIDGRILPVLMPYRVKLFFGTRVLVDARDQAILDAVLSLDNSISRIDGEWLMDIRREPYE